MINSNGYPTYNIMITGIGISNNDTHTLILNPETNEARQQLFLRTFINLLTANKQTLLAFLKALTQAKLQLTANTLIPLADLNVKPIILWLFKLNLLSFTSKY